MADTRVVKNWIARHADEYETSTELAEAAAQEFDLYEDDEVATIPEWVFELAAVARPTW